MVSARCLSPAALVGPADELRALPPPLIVRVQARVDGALGHGAGRAGLRFPLLVTRRCQRCAVRKIGAFGAVLGAANAPERARHGV